MLKKNYKKYLRSNETLLLLIRPFWLSYFRSIGLSILLVAANLFFFYPFLALGKFGLVIYVIALICIFTIVLRVFILINTNWTVVTNKRVLDKHQPKIFGKTITECGLEQIINIRWSQKGLWSTFLNWGTIIIEVFGLQGKIELSKIKNPRHIVDNLQQILAQSKKNAVLEINNSHVKNF